MNRLCLPNAAQCLGDTNIVRLKLVKTHGGGQGEATEKPHEEAVELGYTLRTEVVGDGGTGGILVRVHSQSSKHNMRNCAQWAVLLETDVGVDDYKTAENGVHNGVEGTGSEGSDGERNETHTDSSGHQVLAFWFS